MASNLAVDRLRHCPAFSRLHTLPGGICPERERSDGANHAGYRKRIGKKLTCEMKRRNSHARQWGSSVRTTGCGDALSSSRDITYEEITRSPASLYEYQIKTLEPSEAAKKAFHFQEGFEDHDIANGYEPQLADFFLRSDFAPSTRDGFESPNI